MKRKNLKKSQQPLSRKTMKKTRGGLGLTTEAPTAEGQATGKRQHDPMKIRFDY